MKKKNISKVKPAIPKANSGTEPFRDLFWKIAIFISLITTLFYLPVLNNGFVNWDDAEAIIENHHIRAFNGSFFHWMFTTFHTGNWIPLTWFSFDLDYAVGGLNPKVYHFHNLILQLLCSTSASGTVAFFDGTTLLDTVPLTNGTAVFISKSFAVGCHSLTAVYSGDANFSGATSPPVILKVKKVPCGGKKK